VGKGTPFPLRAKTQIRSEARQLLRGYPAANQEKCGKKREKPWFFSQGT